MIKTVTVTNYLGESLTLELSNPFDIGINVRSIEGIGPPKGNVNYTEIASGDGGQFNSARASIRNITMQLGLMPVPTVEEARHRVYKYFPLDQQVTLRFETDKRLCEITGWVEECEPDIFSDDETIDISIVCPDPYFYSVDSQLGTVNFSGVVDLLEFPWSNEMSGAKTLSLTSDNSNTYSAVPFASSSTTYIFKNIGKKGEVNGYELNVSSSASRVVAILSLEDWNKAEIKSPSGNLKSTNVYIFVGPDEQSLTYRSTVTMYHFGDGSYDPIVVDKDVYFNVSNAWLVVEINTSNINAVLANDCTITLSCDDSSDPDPDPDPDPEPDPDPDPEPGEDNGFPDPPGDYPLYPVEVDQADTTNQYIEFASLVYRQEENIPYDGDVPTGVVVKLHATGEVRNITIYNMNTRERIVISTDRIEAITGHDFNTGDDIIITTTRGSKSIEYVHEGISYNILNALEKDTDWFMLSKGDNVFAYICEYGTEDLQFRLEYPILYWGI